MKRRGAATIAGVALAAVCLGRADAQAPARRSGAAWQIVEWPSGAIVSSEGAERLRVAAQPGSFIKLPTLIAAFAAGLATPDTRVPCKGEAVIAGHTIRCSHPRLRHPLRPAEALALSCNVWFATIGARLPRARLDGALAALGLPPSPPDAPMPLAATGLRATAVSPLMLVDALGRVLRDPSTIVMSERARSVVLDGLRGAALYGTASAFAGRGLDVAAKTGTADAPGGGVQGLVVAAWPARAPTRALVLVAAGAAGADAAQIAAEVATSRPTASPATSKRAATGTQRPRAPEPSGDAAIVLRVGTPRGSSHEVRSYDLEDYVARVLAGEGAVGSAPAAMEALAVAVRTFALANRGRHARDGFDLCTLTHCQVLRAPNAAVTRAAAVTEGQVLTGDGGRPASVFFSASCGGRTERPSGVWPGAIDPPFLPSARDRACDGEPRWAAEIPVQDLERALRAAGFSGRALRDVDIDARTGSGRVQRLRLEGLVPETISGQDFRMLVGRTLGWHLIKSTAFRLRRTGGGYRFDGQGFGHGVGLCVLGSTRRAADGDSARDILRAYYPGLAIQRIVNADVSTEAPGAQRTRRASRPPSSTSTPGEARRATAPSSTIRLVLPSSAEGDRGALAALAREALDDLVRRTGRPAPAQIDVVFHPSPDSFRRESGEPWWVAARTRATRIDLLPPTVLRDRGTLAQTLRHELAHVLTAPVLTDRAEWIKEGVAMHFAGERPPASLLDEDGVPRRVRCPDDDDLRRSPSPAAARQAYARAVACVARALADGKTWSELR